MTASPITVPAELIELLDDALSLHQLAQCCRVTPEWVLTHVQAGVLPPQHGPAAPAWITPNIFKVLQEAYGLKLIGKDGKADVLAACGK